MVNGTKTWISNGIQGSCFAVLVKTDPDAQPRHKGMAMFLCEKGPGFTRQPQAREARLQGHRLGRARVPGLPRAGRQPDRRGGPRLPPAVGGLELGRINVAARGVGVAKAALDEALKYSQLRKTFGKPICEHQAIQLKLGEMATRVEAARLLVENAARIYDRGERCDMEAGMAKYFATEAAFENAHEAMRIHGGYGYSKEFAVERLYRDAPLLCIGEGTNEMQRIIIARQLIARTAGY